MLITPLSGLVGESDSRSFILISLFCIALISAVAAEPYYSPNEGKAPLMVQFTLPGGEACDSVEWNFGDGNVSSEFSPAYAYQKTGMFNPYCVAKLPGATMTWTFNQITVANADISDENSYDAIFPNNAGIELSPDPMSVDDLEKQGIGMYALGLYDNAAASYQKAIAISPSDPDLLARYGTVLAGLSRWKEAQAAFSQSLALKEDPSILNAYAGVLIQMTKYQDARDAYNKSLALDGSNAGSYAGSGKALAGLGLGNESAEAYEQSLALDANQASVWKDYGEVLFMIARYADAVAAYEKAISLGTTGSDLYVKYSTALQKAGRQAESRSAMSTAQSMQKPLSLSSNAPSGIPICNIGAGF
ncbi:MAG TPA: tetratricopeptide repeat protein [Methanospirillum sp.]|nr:tetratricopeptide repeat protein [Methanospirillum sp.]